MGIDLSLIWAVIIYFGVMMYVIMDGFDLGIGILFPFVPDRHDRDVMMNTVAPVWDGNETWLVLGGAGLLAAFPLAYAVVLSALYLPLIFMLLGLIFRGVAFEFRFKAHDHERHWWDKAFILGSVCATFFQGSRWAPISRAFRWWTGLRRRPARLAGAFPAVLRRRPGGSIRRARQHLADHEDRGRTASGDGENRPPAGLGPDRLHRRREHLDAAGPRRDRPALVLVARHAVVRARSGARRARCTFALLRALKGEPDSGPFIYVLGLIFLGYTGLAISIWPQIIPPDISIWQAAAPAKPGLHAGRRAADHPFILMYSAWSYYIFRGKIRRGDGYH